MYIFDCFSPNLIIMNNNNKNSDEEKQVLIGRDVGREPATTKRVRREDRYDSTA